MLTPKDSKSIDVYVRMLRIIVVSLVLGLTIFLGVVLVVHARGVQVVDPAPPQNVPGGAALPVITVVAFVMAAINAALSLVVPGVFVESNCKRIAAGNWTPGQAPHAPPVDTGFGTDGQKLLMVNMTRTIIGAALTEGAGFVAVIAYLIEGKPYALGLAAVLIVATALRFPTRAGVEGWIEDRLGRIVDLRQTMM